MAAAAAAAGDTSIIRTARFCNNDSNVNDGTATSIKSTQLYGRRRRRHDPSCSLPASDTDPILRSS